MLNISVLLLSLAGSGLGGTPNDSDIAYRQVDFSTPSNVRSSFTAARCRSIADISSKVQPLFQVKENGEWECTYLLEYPETGHSPSLFIQIRGVHPERWSSFRLKLNFGSLLSRQLLGGRAAAIVYTLIGDQSPLRELDVTLALGRQFDISFSGITLRYKQEAFDASRYNLSGGNALDTTKPR
ncbi:DUF6030 family protein [Agrobacterium sp. SORGH_AS 787]|uniref:DUF6030 family protein n=1 Tax=Agrobacterium sp. SORGH_AS 787 TaxID=3041775 RepID=UPI00277D2778|nr:hypothetical protein [Rhizobium sp. SORGH_AS_0787]